MRLSSVRATALRRASGAMDVAMLLDVRRPFLRDLGDGAEFLLQIT
jgi:hypothetical protein